MKVIIFGDASSIHTIIYIKKFESMGHRVIPVTFNRAGDIGDLKPIKLGSGTPKISGGNFYYLRHIGELARIIKRDKPDHIQCHYSSSYGFIGAAAKILSRSRADISVVCHGTDILGKDLRPLKGHINRWTLARADRIVSVSDEITDRIVSWGIDAGKILTMQYGVAVGPLNEKRTIPFVSNRPHIPNSRLEVIRDAFRDVDFGGAKPVFVIPNLSGQELEEWRRGYPMYSIYSKLPHDAMLEIVSKSACYISLTASDGTALSLLEAMGAGAIPIVSNIPSNRSWILDGLNGFLVRTGDQARDAYFAAQRAERDSMAALNRRIITTRAERTQCMDRIYDFLIGPEKPAGGRGAGARGEAERRVL